MNFSGRNASWFKGNLSGLLMIFGALLGGCYSTFAQTKDSPTATPTAEEYKIGAGDVIAVTVADAPEFNGRFRVSDSGFIEIAGTGEPIRAEGLTSSQLSAAVYKAFVDSKQLRDPRVNVFIDEYHGRTITVLGSVTKPGVYTLNKRTTVLDALSMASGTLPNSGNTVTVVRGAASAEATGEPVGSVKIIELSHLTAGATPTENVEVRNGDVVNVSAAELVYVVGAVTKPGGFVMSNPSAGISAVQAVALAEGLGSLAAGHKAIIVRQSTSREGRKEMVVDLYQMMAGKEPDVVLAPNDILYVPTSGAKQTLKVMGEIAMAAVNGVAIYGLGYRVGYGTL